MARSLRCGLVRPVFLDEGGRDRQYHHGGDHDCGADVSEKIGDDRQGQQQRVQRIAGTAPELFSNRGLALARDEIGPELLQACLRLGVGQAFQCGFQFRAGFKGSSRLTSTSNPSWAAGGAPMRSVSWIGFENTFMNGIAGFGSAARGATARVARRLHHCKAAARRCGRSKAPAACLRSPRNRASGR